MCTVSEAGISGASCPSVKHLSLEMRGPTVSGEALVSDAASGSACISLHTGSELVIPSAYQWHLE
jgi:hypothetical protein